MFPIERIGSTKNAFTGYVDDVRLGTNADFASTMPLDYAVLTANQVIGKTENAQLAQLVKEAEAIFAAYNPDASAINDLAAEIKAVLDDSDYKEADYSRIETLKKTIPRIFLRLQKNRRHGLSTCFRRSYRTAGRKCRVR